ncbi:MAG: cupin-like domain-containing protein [Polyangiaceae bacterium]
MNDLYMVAQDKNGNTGCVRCSMRSRYPRGYLRWTASRAAVRLAQPGRRTVTPLHHDTSTILFCQLYGRKRIGLIPPWELSVCEGATAMYAAVDLERPDRERHPWINDVWIEWVTLEPGEALLLPVGWWHHVRALDVSISLALNCLTTPNRFDDYLPAQA